MTRTTIIALACLVLPVFLTGCGDDGPAGPPAEKEPETELLVGVWVDTGGWDMTTRSRIYASCGSLAPDTLGFAFRADKSFTARTNYIVAEPDSAWTDLDGMWEVEENGDFFGSCSLPGKWVEYTFRVHEAEDGELVMHTHTVWYIELAPDEPILTP